MADYGATISLSQPHTSDESSSEHNPIPNFSTTPNTSASRRAAAATKTSKLSIFVDPETAAAPRKPRGRPPGSKNKPKPPIVITRDREPMEGSMKPVVLEIAAGSDIIGTIVSFAKRNNSGVSVVSANGNVSNVTLRHPISHAPPLSLHGPFGLLSLSGSFLGSTSGSCFSVTLAGGQGQVFGGIVGGKVTAATTVVVVAGMFGTPTVHRLPTAATEQGDNETEQPEKSKGKRGSEECSSAGMSMGSYGVVSPNPISCQVPPDVMPWGGPTTRPY